MNIIKSLAKYKSILFAIIDILIIICSYIVSEFLVSDNLFNYTQEVITMMTNSIIIAIIVYLIFFCMFDVYKNITVYESGKDYLIYILASMISCSSVSLLTIIFNVPSLDAKINLLSGILITVSVITYRLIIRILFTSRITIKHNKADNKNIKNLLIIGGGSATRDIIKIIKSTMTNTYNIIGIIDDDKNKLNYAISGVRILGGRDNIIDICKERSVNVIFFSVSNISNKDKREILNICQYTGARLRILPSTEDIIKNKNIVENLRDVEIEDILGREAVVLDNNNIANLINNNVILVTGAGGSIGSELCRQIIKYEPKQLIMLDIYENTLYDIEIELKSNYPHIHIEAIIASIRDNKRLEEIFKTYKPSIIFHAAAHKHVPLMEISPIEAIKNNVFGTHNLINLSDKYNTRRFILISSDKAVNPTNIMGATKRLCEMMIQAKAKVSNTEYVAVRFGNVLGSNGSVIPLFKKQIANGGPVTVTHKEITRFFMTIPEAVQLILQAITYANGGEIFVLDMGEPIRIYDLAISLIKLSGLEPNIDIPIKITGLRPGEKLYEELLMSEEGLQKTNHNKIFVAEPMDIKENEIEEKLSILQNLINEPEQNILKIKEGIKQVVPTYKEETHEE